MSCYPAFLPAIVLSWVCAQHILGIQHDRISTWGRYSIVPPHVPSILSQPLAKAIKELILAYLLQSERSGWFVETAMTYHSRVKTCVSKLSCTHHVKVQLYRLFPPTPSDHRLHYPLTRRSMSTEIKPRVGPTTRQLVVAQNEKFDGRELPSTSVHTFDWVDVES